MAVTDSKSVWQCQSCYLISKHLNQQAVNQHKCLCTSYSLRQLHLTLLKVQISEGCSSKLVLTLRCIASSSLRPQNCSWLWQTDRQTDRQTEPKIPAQAVSIAFDDLINGTNFSSFTIWFQRFRSAAALLGFVLVTGLCGKGECSVAA